MSGKRFHTHHLLLFSLAIVALGYIRRSIPLPLSRDSKLSLGYRKESFLNFTELTALHGYVSEEHRVITEDGYILTIFRIAKAKNCQGKKRSPPVLLMHGLLLSSDAWIDSGPSSGLAYLISDECHDLWVGNCRGNYYSRAHTSLNPDKDPQYWRFDTHEIGVYDNPAMIDYILKYTGSKQLNYVGFSQGVSTYLIMCSEKPGYCNKAQIMIALAPAARNLNTKSFIFRLISGFFGKMENILEKFGVSEVLSLGTFTQELLQFLCQTRISDRYCDGALQLFDHVKDFHYGSLSNETIRNMFGHFPAGTSVKNMAWYGQSINSHWFKRFDYGKEKNLIVYGSEDAPHYNLSAATVPIMCLYGENDGLVDSKDVKWLLSQVPNVVEVMAVKDPLWNHLDMTYSRYSVAFLFPNIKSYLFKYSQI